MPGMSGQELVRNPLAVMFHNIVELFELERNRLLLTVEEIESGNYQSHKVEELFSLARTSFVNSQSYGNALIGQNPEFSQILDCLKVSPEEILVLPLLLKESLQTLVNDLYQSICAE